ncbi:hypothetical protein D3C72_1343720 [compost metagenome]
MTGKDIQPTGQIHGQPGIAQAIHHQIHAQRENHDLPRCLFHHLARGNLVATGGDAQQQRGTHGRYRTDRNAQRLQRKAADQQNHQHRPTGVKRGFIVDRGFRMLELLRVIRRWNVATEKPQQHAQRRRHADEVDRHHHRCVAVEADVEEVCRNNVDQVRYHQRQARRVGNKTRAHDERQRRRRGKP